jgi:hypothetical protein
VCREPVKVLLQRRSVILNDRPPIAANLAEIYRDLIALREEFNDFAFRTDRQKLSVVGLSPPARFWIFKFF